MKKIYAMACLVSYMLMVNSLSAALTYSMATSTPGFTALTTKTAVANFNNGCADQMVSSAISIGFTFSFDGNSYTQFMVSDNGQLFLGNLGIACNENCGIGCTSNYPHGIEGNDLAAGIDRPAICPLWDELGFVAAGSGTAYQLSGTSPNRVLTVEWLLMDWKANNNNTPHGAISFQVKLYESPAGQIDFIYRRDAQVLNTTPGREPTASIGLMGASDWYSTDNTGSAISKTVQTAITTKPADGVRYRWTNTFGLPIELLYFTGLNQGRENVLEWKTAAEKQNNYFTVERSITGADFAPIEHIKGAGNSSNVRSYSYIDPQLPDSFNLMYYRLKQTDADNTVSYSPVIAVEVLKYSIATTYYDPGSNLLSVSYNFRQTGNHTFSITDMFGKTVHDVVLEISSTGPNVLKISLPFSTEGLYLIKIADPAGQALSQSKFIK